MEAGSFNWLKLRSGSEIRGPQDRLTDERAEKLGYAFATWLAEKGGVSPAELTLAVGRDERPSGERLKTALTRGITAADSDVLDCGRCATPALFALVQDGPDRADGAVMVTASAFDPSQNGFKLMTAEGGLSGGDVDAILRLAAETTVPERLVAPLNATGRYYENLRAVAAKVLEDDALKPLLGMRVVVDERNAVGADFAQFLSDLGVETEGGLTGECATGPKFPEALDALSRAVLENRADLGVSFTADGDRVALVDEQGRALAQNRLIALVAAVLLDNHPGMTIVTDSVTSNGLSAFIAEWGGVHYRFKRGYRSVIHEAIRLNEEGIDCPLAMETSGHAAFRENGFLDDGAYLATRLICEALNRKREGQTLSALIDDLQEPVESVEIRLPILPFEDWEPEEEAQEIVEILLSRTLTDPEWQLAPDNREGARITFNLDGGVNNAWVQLRMSVHDPVMVLNAESAVPGGVKRILAQTYALIRDTEKLDVGPLREAVE